MAMTALKIKVMPESPETNLDEIKKEAEVLLAKEGALNMSFEEEPIAFGLKALIVTMAWPEQLDTDKAENVLAKIPAVSTVEIIDYRRAFG